MNENHANLNLSLKDFLFGNQSFSQDMFKNIPSCFATVYTWVWNTKITEDGIREKIDVMRENKIRAFYILPEPYEFRPQTMITHLEPEYLSEEYFSLVHFAVSYAEKNGLTCWLYDEGGWPSGSACGRIVSNWHSLEQTEKFIESTYVPYAKALKDCHPELMFTDEPNAGSYVNDGYEKSIEAFTASLKKTADFCHENGWLFAGHLDNDNKSGAGRHNAYGSALQCLQTLDIPGVDVISYQIASGNSKCDGWDGDMPFYPRMASSASSQIGHALALSETFAVYGNSVSPDEMRWIIGSQIVRGINLFNFMLMPYSDEESFSFQERTDFTPAMPGFGNLHAVTEEFERACYFMSHGKPETDTAIIFPDKELWGDSEEDKNTVAAFCKLGESLEKKGIDFDITDEKTLARGTIKDGILTIGYAKYRQLLTLPGQKINDITAKIIKSVSGKSKQFVLLDDPSLWHKVRKDENGNLFICLFNSNSEEITSSVHIESKLPLYRMDAKSGEAKAFENGSKVTLQTGEMLLLYAGNDNIEVRKEFIFGNSIQATPIDMQKTKQLILSEKGAKLVDCQDEPVKINKDFASAFGEDFSGEVKYRYSFKTDKACKILISLKNAEDTAKVELNGNTVGYFTTSPYMLEASALCGENELTVTVSNPAANAFVHFDADKYFTPAQLGPYHERALKYEKENCRGGIQGPVIIKEIKYL